MNTKKPTPPVKGIRTDRVLHGMELRKTGLSWRKSAAQAGCSVEAIRRALAAEGQK